MNMHVAAGCGVARGDLHGAIAHGTRAAIDEVRIRAVALPPERFLFAGR